MSKPLATKVSTPLSENVQAVNSFAEHVSTIRQSGDLLLPAVMMTEQSSVFVFGTVDTQQGERQKYLKSRQVFVSKPFKS